MSPCNRRVDQGNRGGPLASAFQSDIFKMLQNSRVPSKAGICVFCWRVTPCVPLCFSMETMGSLAASVLLQEILAPRTRDGECHLVA